jgi:hypothetical protein
MDMRKPAIVLATLIAVFWVAQPVIGQQVSQPGKISRFGEYREYSAPVYDIWDRTSRYLTMRDGVRLTTAFIRPALNGQVEAKPLPATADQKAKAGSLMTYGLFVVFFVLVLVFAFTYYMRRRGK